MTDPYRLDGQIALVGDIRSVGAVFKNGKAISAILARRSTTVVAADVDLARAEETCAVIYEDGGTAHVLTADVTNPGSLKAARDELARDGPTSTLLVRNAGGSRQGDAIGYSSAKAALIKLLRQIALRLAKERIRCNTVIPSVMRMPMVEVRLPKPRDGADAESFITARNKMRRLCDA